MQNVELLAYDNMLSCTVNLLSDAHDLPRSDFTYEQTFMFKK
jgi:hypothetical protein